jgi:hypothetical protein
MCFMARTLSAAGQAGDDLGGHCGAAGRCRRWRHLNPNPPPEITMRPILFVVFAAFGAFSLYAMWQVGYFGIWQAGMASVGAWQLLVDFVITSFLLLGYMARDARQNGRKLWPYALITLAAGSFGPMLYLLLKPSGRSDFTAAAAAASR